MLATENCDTKVLIDSAIAKVGEIATLPEVTVRIIKIVEDPKSTARDLHEVIKNDPALSTRLLKVVNSAFYGLPGQIASVDRAIVLLGLSAVKNISIAASMTQLFNAGASVEGFSGVELWRHAIAVGVAARQIVRVQGKPAVEESFLAGLIHDLGLLVERQVYGKQIAEVIARHEAASTGFWELELEIIGADHQAFGMALANKWRFPMHLCNTIGYHHKPMELAETNRGLPTLIHLADILACRCGLGFSQTAAGTEYRDEILDLVGIGREALDEIAAELPEQLAIAEAVFS
ncbi:MAG: HDOD domain-containing protein [Planctomycetota bacterium]